MKTKLLESTSFSIAVSIRHILQANVPSREGWVVASAAAVVVVVVAAAAVVVGDEDS
jgi:membrane-associated PAP2 superfamily phosphatase